MTASWPSITLYYHFYAPDTVVSARLYQQLAEALAERGYKVRVVTSCRVRGDSSVRLPRREVFNGVSITRLWRPAFSQDRALGRVLNTAFFLIGAAFDHLWNSHPRDERVILGTDPPLLYLLFALPRRGRRFYQWTFDVFPEAAFREGILSDTSFLGRFIKRLSGWALKKPHTPVLLSDAMNQHFPTCSQEVSIIPPWALVQSEDSLARSLEAQSRVLYSGSFGRAHVAASLSKIVQCLSSNGLAIKFTVPESQVPRLRQNLSEAASLVEIATRVPESALVNELQSSLVHLVVLRDSFLGLVEPSKFFAALAVGRPVLFVGPSESGVAKWISWHKVGWVVPEQGCSDADLQEVILAIKNLSEDEEAKARISKHCIKVYKENFSFSVALQKWEQLLEK